MSLPESTKKASNAMWTYKQFKTKEAMNKFLSKKAGKIQFVEVFVNNAYAIEYRNLRRVY